MYTPLIPCSCRETKLVAMRMRPRGEKSSLHRYHECEVAENKEQYLPL